MKTYLRLCFVEMIRLYSRGRVLCEVRILIKERFFATETDCTAYIEETEAKERVKVDV
jgi:hypothetical protein